MWAKFFLAKNKKIKIKQKSISSVQHFLMITVTKLFLKIRYGHDAHSKMFLQKCRTLGIKPKGQSSKKKIF